MKRCKDEENKERTPDHHVVHSDLPVAMGRLSVASASSLHELFDRNSCASIEGAGENDSRGGVKRIQGKHLVIKEFTKDVVGSDRINACLNNAVAYLCHDGVQDVVL
jgi:hypothetical protein